MTLKELRDAINFFTLEERQEEGQNLLVEFYDEDDHKLVLYGIDDLILVKRSDGAEYYAFKLKL